jgi:hypothetical protein
MKMLDIKMFFLSPLFRIYTRLNTAWQYRPRSRHELLDKTKEFERKMVDAERVGNLEEKTRYLNYLTVLNWATRNEQ